MSSRRRRQGGQALVVLALVGLAVFGFGALALDQGIGMADRRDLQAIADSAALAGSRSLSSGTSTANYVTVQYAARNLGLLPSATSPGCTTTTCAAGTYTIGAYSFTLGDNGTSSLDLTISHTRHTLIAGVIGVSTAVTASGARAASPGPVMIGATYALAAVGSGSDALVHGGGVISAPTGNVSGPVYASGSFGANNTPHAPDLPYNVTNYDGTACSPSQTNHVDVGGTSDGLDYVWSSGGSGVENHGVTAPDPYSGSSPTPPSGTYTTTSAAKDGSGNWKPGTYNGIYPSGGTMNAGVYKIINASSISLGSITNTTHTTSGTEDTTGAVAIVVDSSDTGSLDITNAVLNGLDDLHSSSYTGTRDPQGTHNFVVYGGNGSTGFTGSVTIGPHATTDMSGIIYMPESAWTFDGNSSPQFTGSVMTSSLTINGGGNGTQTFNWICNLSSVSASGSTGGLLR